MDIENLIDEDLGNEKKDELTASMIENLKDSFKWMKIVSILSISLLSLAAIFYFISIFRMMSYGFGFRSEMATGMIIFLLIVAGEIALISVLLSAANAFRDYLAQKVPRYLEEAFKKQRLFWQISGILTIVIVCIYVLIFLFGLASGMGNRFF